MLSYRAWQKEYGSDPSVVGSTFIVSGYPFTIVGITPPGFFGETLRGNPPQLWLPLQQEPLINGGNSLLKQSAPAWLRVIGRVKPGADISGLSARFTVVLRQWMLHDSGWPPEFLPLIERSLSKQFITIVPGGMGVAALKADYGNSLEILFTVCILVLLIVSANIANLMLARGAVRRLQTSLRIALGASRKRIVRQSLTESIVLSTLGGVSGIGVAYLGVKAILAFAFPSVNLVPIDTTPSLSVLAFGLGVSLFTGILFGTAPAWIASHGDPGDTLRRANRGMRDHSSLPQRLLVVLQAALSIVLLVGAGLLTRSLSNLQHHNFGFETERRLSIVMNPPPATYSEPQLNALYRNIQDRLSRVPGVQRAALAAYTPFMDNWSDLVVPEGQGAPQLQENSGSAWDRVGPGFLETMGQPILRGRTITDEDSENTRNIAVVNQAFADHFFKDQNATGKHFGLNSPENTNTFEIVGIVGNANYIDPKKPIHPMFFAPLAQHVTYKTPLMQLVDHHTHYITGVVLLLRSNAGNLEPQIRKAFGDIDPNLVIVNIRTMQAQVYVNFDEARTVTRMTGLLGMLALILATIGLYGVTAYNVEQRTSEIGIRIALGADRTNVVLLILRGTFLQVLIGLAIGIPGSLACGRLIASQLYQVKSWDPFILIVSVAALGLCALLAGIIPARRASSINPMIALRND
jgi:predicted permease